MDETHQAPAWLGVVAVLGTAIALPIIAVVVGLWLIGEDHPEAELTPAMPETVEGPEVELVPFPTGLGQSIAPLDSYDGALGAVDAGTGSLTLTLTDGSTIGMQRANRSSTAGDVVIGDYALEHREGSGELVEPGRLPIAYGYFEVDQIEEVLQTPSGESTTFESTLEVGGLTVDSTVSVSTSEGGVFDWEARTTELPPGSGYSFGTGICIECGVPTAGETRIRIDESHDGVATHTAFEPAGVAVGCGGGESVAIELGSMFIPEVQLWVSIAIVDVGDSDGELLFFGGDESRCLAAMDGLERAVLDLNAIAGPGK